MKLRPLFASILVFFTAGIACSQGVSIQPLTQRYAPKNTQGNNLAFSTISDTLDLPFFDNFTVSSGYPSAARWTDNQAWINNTFSQQQPDYNMATLDHLDPKGMPWNDLLNKSIFTYADSLTSQPINLQFYKTGPITTKNYQPSDSVYLSFFFQTAGLGDIPEAEDSLLLFFKNKTGQWQKVWWQTGKTMKDFKQVMVPITQTDYLFGTFQFRWVNFTKSTGNLNHWHLDYVRIERNRNYLDTGIRDVAIRNATPALIKDYTIVPYNHFLNHVSDLTRSNHLVSVNNLNSSTTVQTRFQLEIRNRYNAVILLRPFSLSSKNIAPGADAETFGQVKLDTLSGENPYLNITYKIAPQSDDVTPDNYNADGDNNQFQTKQQFNPWYAWDDGSAEGGIGLNYEFLPDIKGQFAMRFDLLKTDTLRGLSVFFNRSLEDVSNRKYRFRIWRKLSPVGAPDNQDLLVYESPFNLPVYADTLNGFRHFYFDTTLALDAGEYFIGWIQYQKFVLNVGYDNNYRYQDQDAKNPNLFYNLLGQWESVDASIKGTPMIRPLIGSAIQHRMKTTVVKRSNPVIIPNPANESFRIGGIPEAKQVLLFDAMGKMVLNIRPNGKENIRIEALVPGVYHLECIDGSGIHYHSSLIKQ
jgi:hypothetical protein